MGAYRLLLMRIMLD